MSKYQFSKVAVETLNVRIDKETADEIRKIAEREKISIQEVCRTFLRVALDDYVQGN